MAKSAIAPLRRSLMPKNEHWERNYDATAPSSNMIITEGSDFNPKCSEYRKTTHIKVNREDH